MFKGKNQIKLCQADMIMAIEYWLANKVLRSENVKVTKVSEEKSSPNEGHFVISFEGGDAEKAETVVMAK